MVVACNTASVAERPPASLLPVIDMVAPAVGAYVAAQPQSVGVLGTTGTVHSGTYQAEINRLLPVGCTYPSAVMQSLRLVGSKHQQMPGHCLRARPLDVARDEVGGRRF